MKLIILLIVLGLERYLGLGHKLKRFCCFDKYLYFMHNTLSKQAWFNGMLGAAATILPLPVVATLLVWLMSAVMPSLGGLIGLITNAVVLFYCLGPRDLYHQVYAYLDAQKKNEKEVTTTIEQYMQDGASPSEPHAMTKAIFWQANQGIFGVLVWFILLGVFGAILYRCTVMLRQASNQPESEFANQAIFVQQIQNGLDWLPVRLFTLFFALVGQFNSCFSYWLENIISGLSQCRRFITEGALIALGTIKTEQREEQDETYHAALSMIDRALIIFLAVVALFTLGSWIY